MRVIGMGSTLASAGIDLASEITQGRLVLSSDPVSTDGVFNITMMLEKLEDALSQALKDGYKGLWASGDMTWEFGPEKDFSKLMEYELKLEEVFSRRKELCGICQYHKDTLPEEAVMQSLLVHRGIIVSDTISHLNPHYLKSAWPVDTDTSLKLDEMLAALYKMQNIR
jgi:hypothetical protein